MTVLLTLAIQSLNPLLEDGSVDVLDVPQLSSEKLNLRSLRKSEMGNLRKLLGDVFFAELPDIQPHAINDENAGNLLVVKIGDKVKVKLIKIDDLGRLDFSIKALLDKPEGYSEPEKKRFQKR